MCIGQQISICGQFPFFFDGVSHGIAVFYCGGRKGGIEEFILHKVSASSNQKDNHNSDPSSAFFLLRVPDDSSRKICFFGLFTKKILFLHGYGQGRE